MIRIGSNAINALAGACANIYLRSGAVKDEIRKRYTHIIFTFPIIDFLCVTVFDIFALAAYSCSL